MSYEIVRQVGDQADKQSVRQSFLVKVTPSLICRESKTFDLYETDYVLVESLRIFDEGVTYEETHVVASDEEGHIHDAVLYLATRALTVPEAMFSIGEHNYDPSIEQEAEETNGD